MGATVCSDCGVVNPPDDHVCDPAAIERKNRLQDGENN